MDLATYLIFGLIVHSIYLHIRTRRMGNNITDLQQAVADNKAATDAAIAEVQREVSEAQAKIEALQSQNEAGAIEQAALAEALDSIQGNTNALVAITEQLQANNTPEGDGGGATEGGELTEGDGVTEGGGDTGVVEEGGGADGGGESEGEIFPA